MLTDLFTEKIIRVEQVSNHPFLTIYSTEKNNKYIIKNFFDITEAEEHHKYLKKAESFGIDVPKSVVVEIPPKKYALAMEYINDALEFSPALAKQTHNYIDKLARILAFNVKTGNLDNFLFIGRYLDNIYYAYDPEYTQMNLQDNPIVNSGNILIARGTFWLIDIDFLNKEYMEFSAELPSKVLDNICVLFSNYMKFDDIEKMLFTRTFLIYYHQMIL